MFPSMRRREQRGGIMLLTLFILIMFIIILSAFLRFIILQSSLGTKQEQEEQAFEIADAGINYATWLLSDAVGTYTPQQLQDAPPSETQDHPVTNQAGEVMGHFSLTFSEATPTSVFIRSVGVDVVQLDLCQVIEARAQEVNGDFQIVRWNHLVGYPC